MRISSTARSFYQRNFTPSRCIACGPLLLFALPLFLLAGAGLAQSAASPDNSRRTAISLEQQGDDAGAESAWRTYLSAHPSSSEAYAHLGLLEARQQHYPQAVKLYRMALAMGPSIPGLHLDLGLALFKQGETQQALAEFAPLLKSAPANSADRQKLLILVGMCHYGLRQYSRAASYLQQAADKDPSNLPILMALAHSYLWSKQYQQVLGTYKKILQLNPDSAEADMLAGEALDELKNTSAAIEQFRAAVKADPRLPDVHFGLGYLLWTQRQYPAAVPEFQAELDNDPNHAQALTYLGDCNLKLSHPDAAAPLLEKAVRIDPSIALAHLDLGIVDADAGRQQDALTEMMAAARLAPGDVDVHWHLGRLYRAMGRQGEARAEFAKARSITQAADTALLNKMKPRAEAPSPGK